MQAGKGKKRKIIDMKSLLVAIVKNKNWQQRLQMHDLFEFWGEAVGKTIAAQARPYVIRGDVLWVNVTDSVWMQHLQMQKNDLIMVINARLQTDKISDIRFRLDDGIGRVEEVKSLAPKPVVIKEVDLKKLHEFENMISSIENSETRDSMKNLWIKMHQVRPSIK